MKLYKVVRRLNNGDRVSAVVTKTTMQRSYIHHGKVIPVDNGLVFDNAWSAINFMGNQYMKNKHSEVWECQVQAAKYVRFLLTMTYVLKGGEPLCFHQPDLFKRIRNGNSYGIGEENRFFPSPHVLIGNQITLTKKIKEYKGSR